MLNQYSFKFFSILFKFIWQIHRQLGLLDMPQTHNWKLYISELFLTERKDKNRRKEERKKQICSFIILLCVSVTTFLKIIMFCSESMSKSLATAVQWYGQERINQIWVSINTLLAFSSLGLISIIKIRLALSSITSVITIKHNCLHFQCFFFLKSYHIMWVWYETDLPNYKRIQYKIQNMQLMNEQHVFFYI